jgi:hypothetical protein
VLELVKLIGITGPMGIKRPTMVTAVTIRKEI